MRLFVLLPAALLLLAGPVRALPEVRVVDETGAPIPAATVKRIPLERGLSRVEVRAEGYYNSVHTLADDEPLAPIVLVARQAGRQLLVFAGDSMLARRYFEPRAGEPVVVRRDHLRADGEKLLAPMRPYLQLADYASLNLESPLAAESLADPLPKLVTFYSPAEFAGLLEWAGFDYAALGNNHTYDFRDAGIISTIAALQPTGLGYSGMGLDEAAARAPYRTDLGGQPYAFLSYVGWAGTFSPSQAAAGAKGGAALGNSQVFVEDLATLGDDAVSVLQYHAGLEYAEQPSLTERTRLQTAIDAGADVVIGHHAHVLQGLDLYGDRLVAYSMGNFLFDQYHYATQMGMLLYVWMDGDEFHRAEVVPLNINGYVPTPATGAFRYAVLNRVARLSRDNGVCLSASGAHAAATAQTTCSTGELEIDADQPDNLPLALWQIPVSPLAPQSVAAPGRQYRLGTDLLRRGDFESAGLFGSHERTWLESPGVSIVAANPDSPNSRHLRIDVAAGSTVQTGMKVFERTFRPSNPATVSGRVFTDDAVELRFLLQRRRSNDSLSDALAGGPLLEIATLRPTPGGWVEFAFDHDFPRISTRSIRLLIEVSNVAAASEAARVRLDDLAWIEWRTPWLGSARDDAPPAFGTHLQLRRIP